MSTARSCDESSVRGRRLNNKKEPLYCEGRVKPTYRGTLHAFCALILTPIGCALLIMSGRKTTVDIAAALVFSLSVLACFSVSGLYHCVSWSEETDIFLQKLDHACISLVAAGSHLHLCLYALDKTEGIAFMSSTFAAAFLSFPWIFYGGSSMVAHVVTAATSLPFFPSLYANMGPRLFGFALSVWLLYAAGMIIFKLHRPDPWPTVFGYHEVFHVFVVLAVTITFYVHCKLVNEYTTWATLDANVCVHD